MAARRAGRTARQAAERLYASLSNTRAGAIALRRPDRPDQTRTARRARRHRPSVASPDVQLQIPKSGRQAYRLSQMRSRCVLLLLAMLAAAGCSSDPGSSPATSPAGSANPPSTAIAGSAEESCSAVFAFGPLPAWARSGFYPPDVAMPHVMGEQGNIVAILWARHDALHAPPLANQGNKILWVSRQPGAPLTIRATLQGADRTAILELPNGTGPSLVNLPAAGCWTLNLSWPGHHDRVDLQYVDS